MLAGLVNCLQIIEDLGNSMKRYHRSGTAKIGCFNLAEYQRDLRLAALAFKIGVFYMAQRLIIRCVVLDPVQ